MLRHDLSDTWGIPEAISKSRGQHPSAASHASRMDAVQLEACHPDVRIASCTTVRRSTETERSHISVNMVALAMTPQPAAQLAGERVTHPFRHIHKHSTSIHPARARPPSVELSSPSNSTESSVSPLRVMGTTPQLLPVESGGMKCRKRGRVASAPQTCEVV